MFWLINNFKLHTPICRPAKQFLGYNLKFFCFDVNNFSVMLGYNLVSCLLLSEKQSLLRE